MKARLFFNFLRNSRGMSLLPFLFAFSVVIILGQQFIVMNQTNNYKNLLKTQMLEAQKILLNHITELVEDEVALRNSRFESNSSLYQCLFADPAPCDENQTYDMILYAPNPPITYAGGKWEAPPLGMAKVAGGLDLEKIFYTRSAGLCAGSSITNINNACPLQAIVRFRPLCGGSTNSPLPQSPQGVCPGRATGIDIIIGIGIFKDGEFKFSGDITNYGDTKIYRIKANTLVN